MGEWYRDLLLLIGTTVGKGRFCGVRVTWTTFHFLYRITCTYSLQPPCAVSYCQYYYLDLAAATEKLSKFGCLPVKGRQRPSAPSWRPLELPRPRPRRGRDGLKWSSPVRTQRRNGRDGEEGTLQENRLEFYQEPARDRQLLQRPVPPVDDQKVRRQMLVVPVQDPRTPLQELSAVVAGRGPFGLPSVRHPPSLLFLGRHVVQSLCGGGLDGRPSSGWTAVVGMDGRLRHYYEVFLVSRPHINTILSQFSSN